MNYIKQIIGFTIGVILTLLLVYFFRNIGKNDDQVSTDYYVLTNQISKMNKMVVIEQDFSNLQKPKSPINFSESKVYLLVKKKL